MNNVIFKIPSRTVPEYHFRSSRYCFPGIVLSYYTLTSQQGELLQRMLLHPLLPDSTGCLGIQELPSALHLHRLSRSRSITTNSRPEQKYSNLRERNPYSHPPLKPFAKHLHYIFAVPCSTKWVLATAFYLF